MTGDLENDIQLVKDLSESLGGGTDFPAKVIVKYIQKKEKIDNMVILSDMMIS
jgi:hypothetical protein